MRRSQILVRRTRSTSKAIPVFHRALITGARAPRLSSPRKASTSSAVKTRPSDPAPEPHTHLITTSDPDPPEGNDPDASPDQEGSGNVTGSQAVVVVKEAAAATSQLPTGLDILWSPDAKVETDVTKNTAIPPQEILDQILTSFHLTLHPQTQHKAAHATASGPPQEPTLALYCPIEGGDYILDATVRELGHRTGADVVVIDAAQLAAGESGHFGKAASVLQLKHNPLHFTPSRSGQSYARSRHDEEDEDEDDDGYHPSGHLTMQILSPAFSARSDRPRTASRKPNTSMPQLKAFFNELINVAALPQEGSQHPTRRPRIVYVRDFPTLASTSSVWYPALLAAVRERRQGPLARPTSPVLNPTTIVFGTTPSIMQNQVRSRPKTQDTVPSASSSRSQSKKAHSENSEDDIADKAREKRLRDRLRKWEKGDSALHDEIPPLLTGADPHELSSSAPGPIMVVDAPDGLPSGLAQMLSRLGGGSPGRFGSPVPGRESSSHSGRFFRTAVVIPSVRSLLREKACRMSRRRELNELAMRMAVLSVGGALNSMEIPGDIEAGSPMERMWADWGHSVEPWTNTKQIADIVVGQAAKALHEEVLNGTIPTLANSQVEWPRVFDAWAVYKGLANNRKAWIKESTEKAEIREEEDEGQEKLKEGDEVVDQIRQEAEDGTLDSYEQKLVSCIVDTDSISTTFNKVHLPPRTIDSVRTIVSLPLLHPDAFSHGILKEHNMTGCLLFGPPGTGKTLLVRALAKEAGCRMLAISPSDVMDMYVGEAEKSVRAIFALARRLAPCVVFIDEIDALFGARSSGSLSGGDHAHRGVITEFMQEMDGLKSNKEDNIMVIGATNRPFDLDDAVLRRLPRRMLVDLPGEKEREEILNILLRDETLDNTIDVKVLSQKTEMFSGSDLKHLCVSAALDSVKERVDVPWRESQAEKVPSAKAMTDEPSDSADTETPAKPPRTLSWRNFEAALKEITPSSSESLGTLADLRKWNQEFGEGRKERKKQVWGKDRFGFTIETLQKGENKVQPGVPSGSAPA